jgi:hypothetical protein
VIKKLPLSATTGFLLVVYFLKPITSQKTRHALKTKDLDGYCRWRNKWKVNGGI